MTVQLEEKVAILVPEGKLDVKCCAYLRDKVKVVLGGQVSNLILDMGKISYIDSKGIRELIEIQESLSCKSCRLGVCNSKLDLDFVIEYLRLEKNFEVYRNREEALKHM